MEALTKAGLLGESSTSGAFRASQLNLGSSQTSGSKKSSSGLGLSMLTQSGIPEGLMKQVSSQLSELQDLDPRFMKDYLAAIMILKAANPKKLEEFVAFMQRQLLLGSGGGTGSSGAYAAQVPAATTAASAGSYSVEVEITMTQFQAIFGSASTGSVTPQGQGAAAADAGATPQAGGRFEFAAASVSETTIRVRLTFNGAEMQASPANTKQDPLTLDLDRSGTFDVTGRQKFDINGDGKAEDTPFVSGADAFLALDVNHDGRIDSGKELFGDQNGAANGYEELAKYDDNKDGTIDAKDAVYQDLQVLGDFNRDGALEQKRLADEGVTAISLAHQATDQAVSSDVTMSQVGSYTKNGRQELAGVLLMKYV